MGNFYAEQGVSREQLAVDLDNSVITIAALIPWSITCALPLAVMHVSAAVSGAVMFFVHTEKIYCREKEIIL